MKRLSTYICFIHIYILNAKSWECIIYSLTPTRHCIKTHICPVSNSLIALSKELIKHVFVFFYERSALKNVFVTVLTCTLFSPMVFSPLSKQRAAGWRSRQRQQIRGTQERRENGGGRGTVYSLTTEQNVLSCPLSSLSLSPVYGCGDWAQLFAACRNGNK